MKKILGLDLGTNSIGWALVNEATTENENSEIIKLGVRVNPLTVDEKTNFEKGRPLTTNADRTLKRGARRNLQRFKLRRESLIDELIKNKFITKDTALTEVGSNTTYQTLSIRAKSAHKQITLEEFAKVLLAINKKRGYKSSRKASNDEEGQAIDGMSIAKELYDKNLTPGQYVLSKLNEGKSYIPDFYRSDLKSEFEKIWVHQKNYYPEILSDDLYDNLQEKNKTQTWAICKTPFNIVGINQKGNATEKRKEKYFWRVEGLSQQLDLEQLAIVLQEINNDLNKSSGYLGAISDRSKELYFNKETVGEYLYNQILKNRHTSLKNQVFYRQDYLDEFEQIWETQSKFHSTLNNELKEKIRDIIIFYQRKLKSQKGLLDFCQFESWEQEYTDPTTGKLKKRTIGNRVISKSSPLFQEAKIWQNLNNLTLKRKDNFTPQLTIEDENIYVLEDENRELLFEELNLRGNLRESEILKLLKLNKRVWKTNFPDGLEGNRTNQAYYNVFQQIAEMEGYGFDWSKKSAQEIKNELQSIFPLIGINSEILNFDANLDGNDFDKQASYQFWHLLYSAEEDFKIDEEDKIIYGNSSVSLKKNLHKKFGFKPEHTKLLANITTQSDYGNLSSKALRKIMPYLQAGQNFYEACDLAGYNHSNSKTAEEQKNKELKPKLEIVKKNSLRNPVVEKILNQMVNVINQVIEQHGKPDEIRIELARELKKSADERSRMTKGIADATKRNDEIKKTITKDFGIPNPTKNDVIRYRLYEELSSNGYKSIFTNEKINREDIFSKKIDIEHIIPKMLLFDDSFSNKTLAYKNVNLKKGKRTGLDFITEDYNSQKDAYIGRVESLYKDNKITKAKRNKLLMTKEALPEDFIERDLRNSQYIAKKAKSMLEEVFRTVVSTSGRITDKLREDWDLINVMKELNLPKYKALGLTEYEKRLDKGTERLKDVEIIKDWTKRNDHRHHAMDALTVSFTTHNHIQYLNNLSAKGLDNHKKHGRIIAIENLITEKRDGKRKFVMPMENFRSEAKKHIESILISFKNKNKVVTKNINITKTKNGEIKKIQLTPRGQLHKETIYGKSKIQQDKPTKLNSRFSFEQVESIVNPVQKELVLNHLAKYQNEPSKAFSGKALKSSPIFYKNEPLTEVFCFEEIFTIRKDINPDNFKNQKLIDKIVDEQVRTVMTNRLKQYNLKPKEAFSNLDENPIWLNKDHGIAIKRVTITGVNNAEPLHYKKDHLGNEILSENGKNIAVDYVSTGNNHHLAVYRDSDGKLQDRMISFFEAVTRADARLPIVDTNLNSDIGWHFLFSLKQNEMFVFASDEFKPREIDLLDPINSKQITPHLFRVQKISKVQAGNSYVRDFVFRHHLETTVKDDKALKDVTFKSIKSLSYLEDIVKVRINHIGQIVQIGEY